METAPELRRCPFCGALAQLVLANDPMRPYSRVECTGCRVTTRVVLGDVDGRVSAELWNCRSPV